MELKDLDLRILQQHAGQESSGKLLGTKAGELQSMISLRLDYRSPGRPE